MNKSSKMLSYVNWRMRVTIGDGRQLVGTFMAFDRHMNLVLGDCEEFRCLKKKRGSKMVEELEQKRTLGLVLLRGENVVSIQVESPPAHSDKPEMPSGPGTAAAAGRGMPIPGMMGFGGAMGGPGGNMAPTGLSSQPVAYAGRGAGMMPPGMGGAPPPMGMPPGFMPPPGYPGPR